ncbi:MAG: Ldh family oxidoreductase [Alphaproteobacteria bacterium]
MSEIPRYAANDLRQFGAGLFAGAGMPADRAAVVGILLVEADLMGHDTHGLNLAPGYLGALESGGMPATGEPEVISDRGAAVCWDGGYLSGVWLVHQAIELACERVAKYGTVSVAIRRSHHIACLAAYLPLATERGLMVQVMSSDPARRGVAPFGSFQPVYTPDPIAIGYPTDGDPVLIDISASATTLGMADRLRDAGGRFDGPWLIDNQGHATDDPNALTSDPPGALQPLGGLDRGHKGYGMGLFVEAMTSGLAGFGRADEPTNWGASVFVQVVDPDAFGGRDAFTRETGWLAEACRTAAVPDGKPPVRMPGDGALARKREALSRGVPLHPTILPALRDWATKLGVALPEPIAQGEN